MKMENRIVLQKFKEAENFLYDIPKFTTKNSQAHTKEFLALLGSPQDSFQTIHVAGSNGKGSVCKFLFEMLKVTGKKVGLFSSPHLVDIRERFLISSPVAGQHADEDSQMCSVEEFLEVFAIVKAAAEKQQANSGAYPTFFEFIFAMGMVLFQRASVDICVLETGLGGRLDATNTVAAPVLTIITSISLEHTEYLGDTIGAIAGEKAGIIKPGAMVIFDANEPEAKAVIEARAKELGSPFYGISKNMCHILEIKRNLIDFSLSTKYDNGASWQIPFAAEYQVMNAALAITGMQHLISDGKISAEQIYDADPLTANPKEILSSVEIENNRGISDEQLHDAVAHTRWQGRMEEVLPDVFFDGAHNLSGITEFVKTASYLSKDDERKPILLFSMVKDKDYTHAIACLAKGVSWADAFVATIPGQRGIPAEELQQIFSNEDMRVEAIEDYKKAFDRVYSLKSEGQKVFCTGSLYFIGALKGYISSKEDI